MAHGVGSQDLLQAQTNLEPVRRRRHGSGPEPGPTLHVASIGEQLQQPITFVNQVSGSRPRVLKLCDSLSQINQYSRIVPL